jgi:hypothetical protein
MIYKAKYHHLELEVQGADSAFCAFVKDTVKSLNTTLDNVFPTVEAVKHGAMVAADGHLQEHYKGEVEYAPLPAERIRWVQTN